MSDTNDVSARSYVDPCASYQALMPAGWLQNYFNTIQTPNTFENTNVIHYNVRIFTRIFSAYNQQKK